MKKTNKKFSRNTRDTQFFPFLDAEEAWFWFIQAQQAKNEGARYAAGMSMMPRPCEPTDILKILDRLYRNRLLLRDHLLVLRHYGRRQLAPDNRRDKEAIAYKLWHEAMQKIEPVLVRKGIVQRNIKDGLNIQTRHHFWNIDSSNISEEIGREVYSS